MSPSGYSYAVHFFTGGDASGTNGADTVHLPANPTNAASFQLNWVTFQFLGSYVQPWTDIQVWLYEQVGTNSSLVGELGMAAVDPEPTQWPGGANCRGCTTFVDFLPTAPICLQPQSEYWVTPIAPSSWPIAPGPGILFTLSSNYTAVTGWRMGPTVTDDPGAKGVFLMFAVDATPSSETCSSGTVLPNTYLSATRTGTNLSLSWPASPYTLYSTVGLDPAVWAPWSATPFRSNANLVISVPPSNNSRYFRLQAP